MNNPERGHIGHKSKHMNAMKILLATNLLLAGACSGTSSCENNQAPKKPQHLSSKPNHAKVYETDFAIPREIGALEAELRRRIEQALACQGTVFFHSQEGAIREADIATTGSRVFLYDKLQCVMNRVAVCTTLALQYEQGKMVNGFTIGGICVPTGAQSPSRDKGFSTKVDLSRRLNERIVFEQ